MQQIGRVTSCPIRKCWETTFLRNVATLPTPTTPEVYDVPTQNVIMLNVDSKKY